MHAKLFSQAVAQGSFSGIGDKLMSVIAAPWRSANRLLLVFAVTSGVILLAAAVAIPNLLRSRQAANEAISARTAQSGEMRQYSYSQSNALTAIGEGLQKSLSDSAPSATEMKSARTASPAPTASTNRKIVRTGSLELTVKSPAEAAEQVRIMAERMGGYLESTQIGGTKDAPVANITIRVPAMHFEDAKAGIRQLAVRVDSEKTDAQDVTRQYVDMEARLRNLRAEEAQYLTIMKSAYKVDDLLSVSQKLSEVRGEIEQQQAEFQTLSKQVETVAITVSLRAVADAQVFGLNWRPLYQLKIAVRDGLDALADYASTMAAILFYVPVILAWGLTILLAIVIGWRLFYWVGRRFFAWPAPVAPGSAASSV
jgi:hypothetical protein